MRATRRTLLRAAGLTILAPSFEVAAQSALPPAADTEKWRHGIAIFGDLKYPAGFAHFDYVNPGAPKRGVARQSVPGTFDNFNPVVAGLKGQIVLGTSLIFETLLTTALDEESSDYGLIAEGVRYPEDRSWVTYRLRADARWHDGRPITPDDVIFSFNAYRAYNPRAAAYYRDVVKVERTGDREITFTFDHAGSRELAQMVGALTVVPKHWFEGIDQSGRKRNVGETMLEPPLGSGPYRIKSVDPGRSVVYERNPNYWGSSLNVRVGHDNFNELAFEYFRDSVIEFEAFKADHFDWFIESTAKAWATGYDFPAVTDKRVIKEEFPLRNTGVMQAFVFNLRRPKFRDQRVRQAFNWAMDFENMNKDLFFGQYTRIASYFHGTELAASGLPEGRELEILNSLRSEVPPEVFTTPFTNPVAGTVDAVRVNLREARRLLDAAGYAINGMKLVDKQSGTPLTVEYLLPDPTYERLVSYCSNNLKRLGIDVTIRTVDDVQYENRLRQWDYDIIVDSWRVSLTPGSELSNYFGGRAASTPGSRNSAGINNPAVDALIARILDANDRGELKAAARALDRILLWNHYVVPQWNYGKIRTARWDRFGRPERLPQFGQPAFPAIWWWDGARAAKTSRS
jgi:microcin C transport system substrate-binding protein